MIASRVAPCGRVKVSRLPCDRDARDAERSENEAFQGRAKRHAGFIFDEFANQEVADVRVAPAMPWLVCQGFGIYPPQHLLHGPGFFISRNRSMVGSQRAVTAEPGTMLQKLAEREQ